MQARAHIQALKVVWPELNDIRIWSRTQANAERLAAETGARAVTIEEAAAADVVLTATASPEPVLQGRWLARMRWCWPLAPPAPPSANWTTKRCCQAMLWPNPAPASSASQAMCDSPAQALTAEIGEVLQGSIRAAIPRDKRIVFKSVGMAIEDLVAAKLVWQALCNKGIHAD